jgi:SAM-dependent methyltransferase
MREAIEARKVAANWGHAREESIGFYTFPPIRDLIYEDLTGNRIANASPENLARAVVEWALGAHAPAAECLSLCCGFGDKDRLLHSVGAFRRCTGLDISENAITASKKAAAEYGLEGFEYEVANLNEDDLPVERYDFIFASGSLHHIRNLEHMAAQIYRSLKPGGVFYCDEYVGPAYSNLGHRHREIINAAVHLIPRRLRQSTERTFCPACWRTPAWRRALYEACRFLTGRPFTFDIDRPVSPAWPRLKKAGLALAKRLSHRPVENTSRHFEFGQVWDISPELIRQADPSEGVRADEIIPVLKRTFPEIEVRPFLGSILFYALDSQFFRCFDINAAEDVQLLRMLVRMECMYVEAGEIPFIHAGIVGRKPLTDLSREGLGAEKT